MCVTDNMGTRWRPLRRGRAVAFTLVEMVVVVAIIVVLMAIVLPAVSRTWDERKAADTETKVRGALATVRMKAVNDQERGLLFALDDEGVQVLYEIEADPYDPTDAADVAAGLDLQSTADRFRVVPGRLVRLPKPYRVMPRSVVDEDTDSSGWDDAALTRQDYRTATSALRVHRNFFSMIFGPDGQLRVHRNVIVCDSDVLPSSPGPDHLGDVTGLPVDTATSWFDPERDGPVSFSVDIPNVLCNSGGNEALNFVSVDGLLVYDDSGFREWPTAEDKRDFIAQTALPLYVARLSGEVIRGPTGENE